MANHSEPLTLLNTGVLTANVRGDSIYLNPGVYALFFSAWGDNTTACDIASFLEISPDAGVTWFDWFIDSTCVMINSTTGGATTVGPIRNCATFTQEPNTVGSGEWCRQFHVFTWPGGRLTFKVQVASGDINGTYVRILSMGGAAPFRHFSYQTPPFEC